MPKKPDRFERMLIKRMREVGFPNPTREGMKHAAMSYEHVATLLRAEHAWMRRQIEQIDRTRLRKDPDTPPNIQIGIAAALDDLERRLAQRRK